jgi:signal transduction histidine kinase/PAS domain-containing protein
MTTPSADTESENVLFPGPGEMAARCRAFDWASTPLGPTPGWSRSLRTIVSTMMESRHPMFLWWGADLVQIFNDGYLPSFGNTGRDVTALGARGREHWAEIWPVIGPQIEQVMTTGEATWHEDHLVPIERNGRLEDVYWTYGYSPVRDDDGAIAGVLVLVQETTLRVQALAELEKARAEAELGRSRLNELFRQAPAFIAVLRGRDFVVELSNSSYDQLVGHREIVGRPIFDALPDLRGQGFEDILVKVMDTMEPFVGREMAVKIKRTRSAPPDLCYVDFIYMPITESDGSVSGIFVHGVDVTDQVNARHEVESARAEAEAARNAAVVANRVKSEFLATMSHELRTPLNAIAGYAQLLELGVHGPVTDAQRVALQRILRSEQHLLSLVNDVLNFAKLEAGRIDYDVTTVRLADVVTAVAPMVEPQLAEKGLRYDVRVANDIVVRADSDKLQQVLLNLMSNAIKFTESGGRISVDTGTRSDGTSSAAENAAESAVFLRVSDTGIGIPRDRQETIFDPFVQIDRQRTNGVEGTGLGLAISRDLARGMGGELRVRSVVGEGSCFTITLPAA